MPIAGYGASGMARLTQAEEGLAGLSRLSLAELAHLDDLVIADVLGELRERRRCGTGPAARYAIQNEKSAGRQDRSASPG